MVILFLLQLVLVHSYQDSGWTLPRPTSTRAYLHLSSSLSWTQAEDSCQQLYGHLARDDSVGELREFLRQENVGGQVWIGLHQWAPADAFHWVDDFSWSDVDIPASSVWGEYVEEYETALCVSLDIDYGYRWDTRYCQGEEITGAVCQIEVPGWIHQDNCNTSQLLTYWMKGEEHFTIKYFPDNETLEAECQCGDSLKKSTICSIDETTFLSFLPCCQVEDEVDEVSPPAETTTKLSDYSTKNFIQANKILLQTIDDENGKEKQTEEQTGGFTVTQPEKYSSTSTAVSTAGDRQRPEHSTEETTEPATVSEKQVFNSSASSDLAETEPPSVAPAVTTDDRVGRAENTTVGNKNTTSPLPLAPLAAIGQATNSTRQKRQTKSPPQWLSVGGGRGSQPRKPESGRSQPERKFFSKKVENFLRGRPSDYEYAGSATTPPG